jgi:hypothetical protein
MKRQKARQNEKIYLIKVIQSDWNGRVRGQPYRILALPEELSLYRLAEAIVAAFDFDFDHAFGFYDNIRSWIDSEECYELFKDMPEEIIIEPSRCRSVKKTKIRDVFFEVKKRMLFLYDYGDEWHFIIEFKGIEPQKENEKYPSIVKSVGEAPSQYGEPDEETENFKPRSEKYERGKQSLLFPDNSS